ncbi:hypothetical protein DWQ65_07110 [Treponema phagedenis]|uniref:Ferric oxidoreductase domain-containing protein n=1 Tax=Treponema phagedenis TaxID=162 RepID=A0A0B7GYB7_TREPH|nr:ferric reductase-like transmembrane domain-containing protein [Treponema phagedenis]EFW38926.1 hypothetical protein HMPREF9554_00566 [Treponema phagedenis F0421]QSH99836.1 hypothetical protein DWQ65_07110 [Treponema phagedenis]TYT79675.1 hypothetical protein FS559_11655 [Treponema phagedenis]CEM62597.1 conserved membrane hypothetical protein [Treponema phagedenis]
MYILISLVVSLVLFGLLGKTIKKHPVPFYAAAIVLVVLQILYYSFGWYKVMPKWFTMYVVNLFKRGAFSTVVFILVMYAGVFTKRNAVINHFYSLRGEMSIIASIFTLGHNIIYGFVGKKAYFINAIVNPSSFEWHRLTATYVSLAMILMLIPLFITSFKTIRKKMDQKKWKSLQKLAYPFFILIYVHTMLVLAPKLDKHFFSIILYSGIYLLYCILRIRKAIIDKNTPSRIKQSASFAYTK